MLDLYEREPDPKRPVVAFDELPFQMTRETRAPLPCKPGRPRRFDSEYRREGTCNLFLFFAPQERWRHVKVTDRRTAADFAHCMRDLGDVHFPEAKEIHGVLDQLNTHTKASLYKAFAPDEAGRIRSKLVFHPTPQHGSWLNMAELELSVLTRQCLSRRLASQEIVPRETAAWEAARNQAGATVAWRFTSRVARVKLHRLYPATS